MRRTLWGVALAFFWVAQMVVAEKEQMTLKGLQVPPHPSKHILQQVPPGESSSADKKSVTPFVSASCYDRNGLSYDYSRDKEGYERCIEDRNNSTEKGYVDKRRNDGEDVRVGMGITLP